MTWKERMLERWKDRLDEEIFNKAYLTERDTSVPYIWEDSDINSSIHAMFYYALSVVRDEVYPDGVIVIEPSYTSTTCLLILDLKTKRVLYNDTRKAWYFYFETEEDFNAYCENIASEIRKKQEAHLTVAEFIYQVYATGSEGHPLRQMDVSDSAFAESLENAGLLDHDELRRIIKEAN